MDQVWCSALTVTLEYVRCFAQQKTMFNKNMKYLLAHRFPSCKSSVTFMTATHKEKSEMSGEFDTYFLKAYTF